MARTIAGMVIIITGASAGIGRALAVELAARGAKLALAARRADRLEALNAELGGSHLCITTDVARREDCERLIASTSEHFGRLDTLVCNAGYGFLRPVAESSPEMVQEIFQTNVFGTLDCVRAAVPVMSRQPLAGGWRGQVMLVSSAVARRAIPFFGIYSATKAAQLSMAEAMRVELAPQQIAVTSVHPIGTETEFGTTSASRSGGKRPKRISGEVSQSAETVARKMVRAIEHPRPEVWPAAASRWALGFATLAPRLADRILAKRREQIGEDS
ncbi:MAG TPA: SDR family NAD(P)-dependent oxidoreductase [Tepidisphaeraceae bacterium]|jgi:short-subunit dehydrogenase|nr:SDR family NAD(P)-dependent oxidoreductase [Tepidisphaeraceae bacterium]